MSLNLPGARGLFSHMQDTLRHVEGKRVAMTRGIHQYLADFRWLAEDLSKRSTILYDLVPVHPTMGDYHDAPRYMC